MTGAQRIRVSHLSRKNFVTPLIFGGGIISAIFIGLAVSMLPWIYTLTLAVGLTTFVLAILNPFAGVVCVLILALEVVPNNLQPRLPLLGGRFQLYDMLLLLLVVVLFSRALINKKPVLSSLGLMLFPLIYLLACILTSVIFVKYFFPNSALLSEGRAHIMWLMLPLVALSVETTKHLKYLVFCVCAMGIVVSVYVVLQSLLEIQIMTGARVEALDNSLNSDVIRSIAGGGVYFIAFTLLFTLNRTFDRRIKWWLAFPLCLILLSGLAVQFGRGVWVATLIGLAMSALLHRGAYGLVRTALAASLIGSVLLSVATIWQPRLAEAFVQRAAGTLQEVESGGSFNWRRMENRAALLHIEKRPLTGVGIGGEYKDTVSARGSFSIETTYIHNAYLYFPLKMGIHAVFIPVFFVLAFSITVRRYFIRWGSMSDRGLIAAVVGGFTVPIITSWTQPEWSAPQGIAALCSLMGTALLMSRLEPWAATGAPVAAS
jgi:hypothetical protein